RVIHSLPTLIECDNIPDDRSEIPTPQVALHHPHLKVIAGQIPEIDPDAPIMMLLGRDIIKVLFGVYHPKKPEQIQVVFDTSCQYNGVSLNDVLLKGPDLNNGLLGVLLRFRKEAVAFTTDIQQMFHCFLVKPEDRNFLRFFWYEENDPEKSVIKYRMKVHIFGNSPFPAVMIYGLRQAAKEAESEFGADVGRFVDRDFYMDDGLRSLPSARAAIDLLKRTQAALARSNLKLHKIAFNSKEVMDAFPLDEQASDLTDMDLGKVAMPVQ
ncbi:hypothetical protein M9458_033243, partial [Cirrhinus mrigala]